MGAFREACIARIGFLPNVQMKNIACEPSPGKYNTHYRNLYTSHF